MEGVTQVKTMQNPTFLHESTSCHWPWFSGSSSLPTSRAVLILFLEEGHLSFPVSLQPISVNNLKGLFPRMFCELIFCSKVCILVQSEIIYNRLALPLRTTKRVE
jgi:hypothetical protein